jgi:hypothetical protein
MVQLDLNKGGGVGGSQGQLYDSTGKLIRTQGAVFTRRYILLVSVRGCC